jgi:hypothetical protein
LLPRDEAARERERDGIIVTSCVEITSVVGIYLMRKIPCHVEISNDTL